MNLVTGAAGFVGRFVVEKLRAAGRPVRLFDLRTPAWLDESTLKPGALEFFRGDVTYRPDVARALDGVNRVYHLAAQLLMAGDDTRMHQVNVEGTRTVLEEAWKGGVEKVVYTSTGMLYPPSQGGPTREETRPDPAGAYGRTKVEAEAVCRSYQSRGLSLTILRPLFVLGPGRLGVMHLLFHRLKRGRPLYLVGRGDNRFHMIHGADLADACLLAMDSEVTGVFNVGAENPQSVRTLFEGLRTHAGTGSAIRPIPVALVRVGIQTLSALQIAPIAPEQQAVAYQDRVLDLTQAQQMLGFVPRHSDLDTLIEAYEWYKTVDSSVSDQPADWPDGGIFKYPLIDRLF